MRAGQGQLGLGQESPTVPDGGVCGLVGYQVALPSPAPVPPVLGHEWGRPRVVVWVGTLQQVLRDHGWE